VELSARIVPNDIEAKANGIRLHDIGKGTHEVRCVLEKGRPKAAIGQPQSLDLRAQRAERAIGTRGDPQFR
jgi:hypothetical protein